MVKRKIALFLTLKIVRVTESLHSKSRNRKLLDLISSVLFTTSTCQYRFYYSLW